MLTGNRSLLIDLPQPRENAEVPKRAGAIGNVVAMLQRDVQGSKAVEVSNGVSTLQKGRSEI